ncbi:hypothetical protein Hdeb2414_s0008g00287001 [Helianthus debilis subsp. tardiflorus]
MGATYIKLGQLKDDECRHLIFEGQAGMFSARNLMTHQLISIKSKVKIMEVLDIVVVVVKVMKATLTLQMAARMLTNVNGEIMMLNVMIQMEVISVVVQKVTLEMVRRMEHVALPINPLL